MKIYKITGYGGIVKLRIALMNKYVIPRPAVETYITICYICNCKNGANRKLVVQHIATKDFNERGQVDLIDFQSIADGKFK